MNATEFPPQSRLQAFRVEVRKIPAFVRRDFLVAWSYRAAIVSDWIGLFAQAIFLYFIGRLVDPRLLPSFGGTRASYLEFVAVGIALGMFIELGLHQISSGVRQEQLMGTLESLLMTPTRLATIQFGAVAYQLLYVPVRTALFLLLIAVGFGLQFQAGGIVPAGVVLLVFIPFVWGLGLIAGASTLTFRRGASGIGILAGLLTVGSGAYFPLSLLPAWLATTARHNPVAVAIDGMRRPLIGGSNWGQTAGDLSLLAPAAVVALVVGVITFRLALQRERRRGSLGLY
jgi:ABC-2 type transport system permease protein